MKDKQTTTPEPETATQKETGDMVIITVYVTRHQKDSLGRDRSFKVRKALELGGYPEQPIT